MALTNGHTTVLIHSLADSFLPHPPSLTWMLVASRVHSWIYVQTSACSRFYHKMWKLYSPRWVTRKTIGCDATAKNKGRLFCSVLCQERTSGKDVEIRRPSIWLGYLTSLLQSQQVNSHLIYWCDGTYTDKDTGIMKPAVQNRKTWSWYLHHHISCYDHMTWFEKLECDGRWCTSQSHWGTDSIKKLVCSVIYCLNAGDQQGVRQAGDEGEAIDVPVGTPIHQPRLLPRAQMGIWLGFSVTCPNQSFSRHIVHHCSPSCNS